MMGHALSQPARGRCLLLGLSALVLALGLGPLAASLHAQEVSGAEKPENQAEGDRKRLQGEWRPVRVRFGGHGIGNDDRDLSAEEAEQFSLKWIFEGDIVTIYKEGSPWGPPFKVVLDPEKNPKHIDLIGATGKLKGYTIKGFYKLEGDKLQVRYRARIRAKNFRFDDPLAPIDMDWILERRKE